MVEAFEVFLSYESQRLIWWGLMGVLLIGFAVTDGFDLGVGALLPWIAHTDAERRVVINVIGPTWEGNQVWFILGGGAIFAAWPLVYAAAFSGLFIALILLLFALILRPVGFKYRSLMADPRWRATWDWALFVGGVVPALLFGVAFGNLFVGLPFHFDADLRVFYTGSFWGLLQPFALLAGLVSLAMLVMHGAIYLQLRTADTLQARARRAAQLAALVLVIGFGSAGLVVATLPGYGIASFPGVDAPSNPLLKEVDLEVGGWLANYARYPWMLVAPMAGLTGALLTGLLATLNRPGWGFITSATAVAGVILTAGFSLFPFIMPSSSVPNSSLTLWDATSSQHTLQWMTFVTAFFMPLILLYTAWVYRVLRGTITLETIRRGAKSLY
ncbi:MAG: cytochrome d ubiquinol oxidase subunit II [Candidatus Competibacterales bacterium]